MKKVLILWLWGQWRKYINYFLKNNYEVLWVCNTSKTKNEIENKFKIDVLLDYKNIDLNVFEIIIIALPIDIQAQVALEISNKTNKKILVEIPVTFNEELLHELISKQNIIFFLEEYFTKFSTLLRKINLNDLTKIQIELFISHQDKDNIDALKVAYVHLFNNFLINNFDFNKLEISLKYHNFENINYKIITNYKKSLVNYSFLQEKYLQIWDKKIIDNYNFDYVLSNLINTDIPKDLYLRNFKYITKII